MAMNRFHPLTSEVQFSLVWDGSTGLGEILAVVVSLSENSSLVDELTLKQITYS
jgi:hypothetical protein